MNRKIIEELWNIVKDYKGEDDYNEEQSEISKIKEELNKFIIKYHYFDKFGLDLKAYKVSSKEFIKVDDSYAEISIYIVRGDNVSYICNSDKQPDNELLMVYSHPIGPYMFCGGIFSDGDYYDPDLFEMYFNELKKYKYKYIDSINYYLYFDIEEGSKLYKNYKKICSKYQKLFDERRKKVKAEKLKEQLKELEGTNE